MADLTGSITPGISLEGTITTPNSSTGSSISGSNVSGQITGGPKGEKGERGEKGDPGTGVNIVGSLDDESELPSSANEGDCYLIDGDLWLWDGTSWSNVGQIKGDQGTPVELRKTETHIQWRYADEATWTNIVALAEIKGVDGYTPVKGVDYFDGVDGTNGTNGDDGRDIEIRKNSTHVQWRYVGESSWTDLIPLADLKGDTGDTGEAATITIGTVTTVTPATPASVTNVGTDTDVILDIEIPQGETGASGSGSGDMLSTNNLSELTNTDTARSNLSAVRKADSSFDNALARFDGITGAALQNSTVTVSDSGDLLTDGLLESTSIAGAPLVAADEIAEYYDDMGILIDGVWIKDGQVDGVDVEALETAVNGKAAASHTHNLTQITDAGAMAAKNNVAMSDLAATGGTAASFLKKDGTWATPTNTTYSEITTAEINAGSSSTSRTISGRRVKNIQDNTLAASYPVGTKYSASVSTLPSSISAIGTWVQTYANSGSVAVGGVSGFSAPATASVEPHYEWKRTA